MATNAKREQKSRQFVHNGLNGLAHPTLRTPALPFCCDETSTQPAAFERSPRPLLNMLHTTLGRFAFQFRTARTFGQNCSLGRNSGVRIEIRRVAHLDDSSDLAMDPRHCQESERRMFVMERSVGFSSRARLSGCGARDPEASFAAGDRRYGGSPRPVQTKSCR